MNQGCVNEGHDHRWNPFGVTCWLQRAASFKWSLSPLVVQLEVPLGLRIYVPIKGPPWFMLRLALWRYDYTAGEYIFFSAAAKKVHNLG